VYALLYGVMLFDLVLGTLRPGISMRSHVEAYQPYLADGCAALLAIRALRAACRLPSFLTQRNGRLT
jgi:hypothetical protein